MCGEKKPTTPVTVRCIGSPPHVRGKDVELFALFVHHGITPACAGKSKVWNEWFRDEKDHPRMCGEKAALPPGVLAPPGSPPRMRGKELAVGVIRQHGGITPAHAGKSGRNPAGAF